MEKSIMISETFVCPENYFKCRGSFCLDAQYVCDGISQCADGETKIAVVCILLVERWHIHYISKNNSLFVLMLNFPVKIFSTMLGRFPAFLGQTSPK